MTENAPGSSLAASIAAAQFEMANAEKDAKNDHFRSGYATLASVRAACIPALAKNGIAVIQQPETDDAGAVFVRTILWHSSGERMESEGPHVVPKNRDAQGIGSAITYLRRYNLMAVAGIAPADDDDGNGASGNRTGGGGDGMELGKGKRRQQNAPANNSGPRVVSGTKRGGNGDGNAGDIPTKAHRNGKEYDDWRKWRSDFEAMMWTAIKDNADPIDCLSAEWGNHRDAFIKFSASDAGQDGGKNSLLTFFWERMLDAITVEMEAAAASSDPMTAIMDLQEARVELFDKLRGSAFGKTRDADSKASGAERLNALIQSAQALASEGQAA